MISSNFKFKLGDFGLAIPHSEISKIKSMCGTPNYLAPEVIDKKCYSYEVDLWAMGVMM
jgi:polo-like kinase 1